MAGFNLADVLNQVSNFQDVLRADTATTKKTVDENEALRAEQADAATKLIGLSVEQSRLEGESKLQMERRKAATAEAFGTDILDPQNRIAYLAREQAAAVDETIHNSKRAAELRDTQLFDSPLDYMLARPFAVRNDNAAQNASERATFIGKSIDQLNQETQSTVKTQEAINQTWSAEQQANNLELIAATAADKVRVLKMNQNTAQLNDLKTLRELGAEGIKQSTNAYTLVRHEQEFNARMAELTASREARKKTDKAAELGLEETLVRYNLGAKELGLKTFSKPEQLLGALRYDKDRIEAVIAKGSERGIDPTNPEAQTVPSYVARTPGESVMVLAQVGGTLPTSAQRVTALLSDTQSMVQQKLVKEQGGKKITGDQMVGGINSALFGAVTTDEKGAKNTTSGAISRMSANVETNLNGDRVKNIYRAPDVATVVEAVPDIAAEKWYKSIIQPAALTAPSPTGQQILAQAKIAVTKGELSPEEASAGIAAYIKTATRVNMATEQYERVGIPIPKSYNVVVDAGPSYFMPGARRSASVDLMDEKKVLHSLMSTTIRINSLTNANPPR